MATGKFTPNRCDLLFFRSTEYPQVAKSACSSACVGQGMTSCYPTQHESDCADNPITRRHEVADDSFGFVLPGADASPEIPPPAPAIRTEPNSSAKRRRLSPDEAPAPATAPAPASPEVGLGASRTSARLSASRARSSPAPSPQPPSASSQARSSASRASARLNPARPNPPSISPGTPSIANVLEAPQVQPALPTGKVEDQAEDDELESLPAAMPVPGSHSSTVSRISAGPGIVEEEVTESPAEAPGSGHRRRIRLSNVATQSARLQRAVMEEEQNGITGEFTTSSPLARKARMRSTRPGPIPARSMRTTTRMASSPVIPESDDSSPAAPRPPRKSDSTEASGSARSTRSQGRRSTLSTVLGEEEDVDELSSPLAAGTSSARKPQPRVRSKLVPKRVPEPIEEEPEPEPELELDAENEQAEEIGDHEAARQIGRKRPRASPARGESPELNAGPIGNAEPAKKKRQKRTQQASPAKQAQPKAQKPKPRRSIGRQGDGEAIPIIVQRYTQRAHINEDDSDADILGADIPFANRGGVNVIDVLAQVCEEVIESNLETLHKATVQAADSATRKEYRTKLRALEAFQEELRTRLLEQVGFRLHRSVEICS